MRRAVALAVCLALGATAAVFAHVRLIHPANGTPLWWNSPSNISIVISSTGSDNISDGSDETAIRNAISEWNGISETTFQLVEDTSPSSQANTNWASNSIHLLYFDENNSSGYFPGGSSTVALTPVWFYSNGRIDDADVLFNGKGYSFTTSQVSGRYDIQDVAVHEIGHLVGLDHTGWAGGSMYPYVDPTIILHRSISRDEWHAMRSIYPGGSHASISGTIKRSSDSSVVLGANVIVRDSTGRTTGAALTSGAGSFDVNGLEGGTYELFVTPLDFPVSAANLGSGWTIQTDFESTVHGFVTVAAGQSKAIGDVFVGDNVGLSLGRNSDRYPLRAPSGQTTSLVIRGTGLSAGSSLSCSDPAISISATNWFGSRVNCDVSVPGGASIGHVDVMVVNAAGDRSILPAALEITPVDPTVLLTSPNQGDQVGGTSVTISGTGFNPGARVIFGGEIYEDAAPGGCTVVNSTTITLTTNPSAPGITDVVVMDASGVEGRQVSGFQFLIVPVITTVFPSVGTTTGSTEFHITGFNFDAACTVRVNGVVQSAVFPVSEDTLAVISESGAAGGPYLLEVENPSGLVATSAFSYVSEPDPVISAVSPARGPAAGGDLVRITGSNFGPGTTITFGADPDTGLGGTLAASLVFVDSTTLEVTTPAFSGGLASVIAADSATGQADVLASGFEFLASSGGGGGSCHTVPVQGPPDWGDVLRTLLWFSLLVVGARCVRPRPAGLAT